MTSPELIIVKRWTWKQITAAALLIVLSIIIFFISGYLLGDTDGISLRKEKTQLNKTVELLNVQLKESQRQLVKLTQISKVDQAANIHAGNSMDSQHQQIRELQRELNFFRSIMAPEDSQKGLQISRFSWQKGNKGTFNWQISLIQAGSQGRAISGYINIELVAFDNDNQIIIPLLSGDQSERFNFRFRYFQHLTGNLQLKEGLTPSVIKIVAYPTLKGQPILEKVFPWQSDEEKIANVE